MTLEQVRETVENLVRELTPLITRNDETPRAMTLAHVLADNLIEVRPCGWPEYERHPDQR